MDIRTIAQLCGVSKSTVSRILNNKADVNPKTREKVINKMNELEFRPMIASNRHETIGVVTSSSFFPEFLGELMNGIIETAYALDKSLTFIPYTQSHLVQTTDMKHYCRSNNLSGVMVVNPPTHSKLAFKLMEQEIPHVVLAASLRDTNITWVDVDNLGGCKEAVAHLIKGGHRSIGLMHGVADDSYFQIDRKAGYIEALRESNIEINPNNIFEIESRSMNLNSPILHMLQSDDPPTALFCTNFRDTLNVLGSLQSLNIKVPEEISLIGFGDYDMSPLTTPPMTTVHQRIYDMGKTAVNVLQEQMNSKKYMKQQITIPTKLIVRKSSKVLTQQP